MRAFLFRSVSSFVLMAFVAAGMAFLVPTDSEAAVVAKVDVSAQRMKVYVNGVLAHSWRVSTGRSGFRTPRGRYRPQWLSRYHRSRKYNNAPMPHSIFFYRGYAIHGTTSIRSLGRRASHGCIRLHPQNARKLFSLVRRYGKGATRIVITN